MDESLYDDPPEGFADWPVLDRIEYNMEVMTKRITIGARARKRLAKVVKLLALAFAIIVVMFGIGVWQFIEQRETQEDLEETQATLEDIVLTFCENGNNTRENQNKFWTYLLDVSRSNPGNQDPDAVKFFDEFKMTIDKSFNQRSCDDLEDLKKKYPPPDFPDIPNPEDLKDGE